MRGDDDGPVRRGRGREGVGTSSRGLGTRDPGRDALREPGRDASWLLLDAAAPAAAAGLRPVVGKLFRCGEVGKGGRPAPGDGRDVPAGGCLLALPLPLPLAGLFGDGNWTGDAPARLPEAEAVDGRAAAAAAAGLPRWLV